MSVTVKSTQQQLMEEIVRLKRKIQSLESEVNKIIKAVCVIRGENPLVTGVVRFEQSDEDAPTKIVGEIRGVAPGYHGFHVHEWGDNTQGCLSAGAHYNPFGKTHGGPYDETRHMGDLGNVIAGGDGVAKFEMTDNMIKLIGRHSVIGRMMVVSEKSDDFGKGGNDESLKTGNAGARVGCGVIGLASPQ